MSMEERLAGLRRGASSTGGAAWRPGGGRLAPAEVVLDSSHDELDALRSTATAEARQLVIAAGAHVVALDLAAPTQASEEFDDEVRRVLGRVDGPGVVAVQVVAPTGAELALAVPDEHGEFEFDVPVGSWTLVIAGDDQDLEVEFDVR